jgi:hypothetical protein
MNTIRKQIRRPAVTALLVALALCAVPKQTATAAMADQARSITVGVPITDNLPSSSDERYYKFTLPAAGKVNVWFDHEYRESSSTYWEYRVFDAEEKEVLYFESEGSVSHGVSMNAYLSGGVYYIRVAPGNSYYHQAADYTLTVQFIANSGGWEIEPNDSITQPSVIGSSRSIVGNLRTSGDVDCYTFTMPSSARVEFVFAHEYRDSTSVYLQYKVLDANQKEIMSFSSMGSDSHGLANAYLEGGVYYIRVASGSSYYHWATDYTLSINYDAPAAPPATTPAPATQTISVIFNGTPVQFDQPPIIEDNRTLVPLRAIFEAMGAVIEWDGTTQTVTATRNNIVVVMIIGNDSFTRNGVTVSLDVPAKIVGNRTLVPARAVAESFGASVEWDGATRVVTITGN